MHLQLDIQGSLRPTGRFVSSSHGKGSRMMFRSMLGSVNFFSRIRKSTHILQGCYNNLPFWRGNGKLFLWTSSRVYHECREGIASMWWWTAWRSLLTSLLFRLLTQQHRWQIFSLERYSSYMGYLVLLWAIEIVNLWVLFGKNCLGCVVQILHLALVIIHR